MDEEIVNKITTSEEMSGLLNWSLKGLKQLRTKRDFSYSKSVNDVRDFWIRKSDSFMAFCLDELNFEQGESIIEKKVMRKAYNDYCKFHKIKTQGDKSIANTLNIHFGITDDRRSFHNDWFHVWDGLGFKFGSLEECKVCHDCHGFSVCIGKKNSIGENEKGGNPAEEKESGGLFLLEDMKNILLDCKNQEIKINDILNKGFTLEQIQYLKDKAEIFEPIKGTIKLLN